MQGWGHSGSFGVHAGVRVAAQDRAGHERLLRDVGVDAEPIPELEFDQTLGWTSRVVEMAHATERGLVWSSKSVLQLLCIFWLFRASNLCEHRTKAVFVQKLIVGCG